MSGGGYKALGRRGDMGEAEGKHSTLTLRVRVRVRVRDGRE